MEAQERGQERGRERGRELGWLRTALDRADAAAVALSGPPGSGARRLALDAASDHPHHYHRVPPLSEEEQLAALAASLTASITGARSADAVGTAPPPLPGEGSAPTWTALLRAAERLGSPAVLVLDDAHRLAQSRARFFPALRDVLADARSRGRTLHVVLLQPEQPEMDEGLEAELELLRLELAPLPFRVARRRLPGADPGERMAAYAIFGGWPGQLGRLDPGVSTATNLRRLVLDERGPLLDAPLRALEQVTQTPARYVAILGALAGGEADWGTVHAGVPDVSASGQLAPYLKRLGEMGLVEVRRSLDAGPRSRNRRYRIVDAFTAFWFRFVFPHREALALGRGGDAVGEAMREGMDAHVASRVPEVCRQYMRHDAIETMGSNARECGSLWGPGYDIPVAGILGSGAAFYGRPVPPGEDGRETLASLDREIRETRYGFGRERRLRVLFVRGPASMGLAREAARRHDVVVVDERALAGEG